MRVKSSLAGKAAEAPCFSLAIETRAQIRLGRDNVAGAIADLEQALELAQRSAPAQDLYPTLAHCAEVLREIGDTGRASTLADEFIAGLRQGRGIGPVLVATHVFAWTMVALGRGQELADTLTNVDVPWVRAAALFATGDLGGSADICATMGAVTEEARDRLWLAESLIKQGRRGDADIELHRALAFSRSVGATRYIREGEMFLAASA